jgi:hypothetical protein
MLQPVPVSVIETQEFLSSTSKMLTEAERALLIDYLAYNPGAGDVIPGTGGVRKLRWGLEGRGKRGGARIIHFYHNGDMPVFALTAFAKNDQTDLSQQSRNELQVLTRRLVDAFNRRGT